MATSGKIPDAEWQRHKATIRRLYIVENQTLDTLMHEMSSSYSFTPSKYQYTTMLKAWKLQKNAKSDIWKGISEGLKRRRLEASEANVYFHDSPIPLKKLKKELQRYTAQGGQHTNDALTPTTPEGIIIQPILEQLRSKPCSIPRSLTVSLPWHNLVDSRSLNWSLPTAIQATLPVASPFQIHSPDWTSFFPESYNVNLSYDMSLPSPWGSFGPTLSKGIDIGYSNLEENKLLSRMSLQNEVKKYFGIESVRKAGDHERKLEQHLRPFVIERQPEETRRAVQELMDPYSIASMQILTSYMALLLSNDLIMDEAVQAFLARANKMLYLGNLKPLFAQGSPSARAVTTRLLHAAVCIDATKFLSQALKCGVDVESPSTGEESSTLLQEALKSGKYEAARILIDAGANVNAGALARYSEEACENAVNHVKGFTCGCEVRGPSHPVALAARSFTCHKLIPELVRKGAIIPEHNPVLVDAIDKNASVDTVYYLVSAGADINLCIYPGFREGETPLCAAAGQRNLQVVRLLLEAGANPNGPLKSELGQACALDDTLDEMFQSPLLCAINHRSDHGNDSGADSGDIVRLLLEFGADPNISALDFIFELEHSAGALFDDNSALLRPCYGVELSVLYPLQAAVELDNMELVKLLLQHKASANSAYGTPALALAVLRSNSQMVRLLLSHGANPNGLSKQPYCQSALEVAVDEENLKLIDILLESGADVNNRPLSHWGRTPLQRAAENGKTKVIEHLLKHRASMLSQPAPVQGASMLQSFIRNGLHKYVSKALNAGANPNEGSIWGSSPLTTAVIKSDMVSLDLLLVAGANIHEYCRADYNDRDKYFDKHLYPFLQLSSIQWAASMNHVEVARILCEAGANVNQPPCVPDGDMALHLAAERNNYAIAKFLIQHQVEVNALSRGRTALHAAACGGSSSMLRLLLENGANPNQQIYRGSNMPLFFTPLDQACSTNKFSMVQTLLCAGADTSQGYAVWSVLSSPEYVFSSRTREILEILLQYGADVNRRHSNTSTALQEAILGEDFHCADLLIKAGAYINAPASTDKEGRTALQAAASVGNVDLVERLLLKGADVNAPAAQVDGVTALQAAAIKGYLRIAQILLENGAIIDAAAGAENGRTAIEGAAEFGRMDMVKLLLDNYQGPTPIAELLDGAHRAAKKGNQWYVMELLSAYEHPGEAWP